MTDGTFDPPERKWAAGTVYLRGQGAGQVRAVHGLDALPPGVASLVVDSRLPRAGQPSSGSYEGDGYITIRQPGHRGGHRRAEDAGQHRSGGARMTVLMISPGYPAEMAFFTRGLGQAGVRVIGLGDQPPDALPAEAKPALDHYVHTGSLAAEDHVIGLVREMARRIRIDQIECLWEPYMLLAARAARGAGPARADRGADRAVPGQGADEAAARRGRPAHPLARRPRGQSRTSGRRPNGSAIPSSSSHRRGGLGRHLPGRFGRRARRHPPDDQARAAGQRGGVRRGRGVHLRHHLRGRGTSWSRTSASTIRGPW